MVAQLRDFYTKYFIFEFSQSKFIAFVHFIFILYTAGRVMLLICFRLMTFVPCINTNYLVVNRLCKQKLFGVNKWCKQNLFDCKYT